MDGVVVVLLRTVLACAWFVAVAASLSSPVTARAKEPPLFRVVDVMPAFWAAWDLGHEQSVAVRVAVFRKDVLERYPSLFRSIRPDDAAIGEYLKTIEPVIPELRRDAALLREQLPRYQRAFGEAFPDFDPAEVTVYVQPSLFRFGGVTGDIEGRHALQFGLDTLASVHADVGVVIVHELFHVYHRQVNPAFFATQSENDLYTFGLYREMWAEGLATYVSQSLNPAATPAQVLLSDQLAALDETRKRRLACLVNDTLDSTARNDSRLLFDSGVHPDGLPPNGGYLIGELAAQRLAAHRSLRQLAALNGDELRAALGVEVGALCGRVLQRADARTERGM